MEEINLSWDKVEELVDNIVEKVRASGKKFDVIIGINRGGLIPSVMLSHKLGVKHGVMTITHYDGQKLLDEVKKDLYISMVGLIKPTHNILVVDDIADSGLCLKEAVVSLKKVDPDARNISTATLFDKPKSVVRPTYVGENVTNDIWINFPWETVIKDVATV
jgi:hypothetical protein